MPHLRALVPRYGGYVSGEAISAPEGAHGVTAVTLVGDPPGSPVGAGRRMVSVDDSTPRRDLDEIFGTDLWSEPEDDAEDRERRDRERQSREREYLENRPPHHDGER
jgi:hypothetical protein